MENKKRMGITGIIILCLTLSALFGVAFASYTQQLTIKGSARVESSKWDIKITKFENKCNSSMTCTGTEILDDTIGTTTAEFSAIFSNPGEEVLFDIDVTNLGTLNARYVGDNRIDITPICKVNNDATHADAVNVCNNIEAYIEFKENSKGLNVPSNPLRSYNNINNGVSPKGDSDTFELHVLYNASSLPSNEVTVTIPATHLEYQQV